MNLPEPSLQIAFALSLRTARGKILQTALMDTVKTLPVSTIDQELAAIAPPDGLAELASRGLRGEILFPVPCILTASPQLLGYYRLLLGYSQKQFYNASLAGGSFKAMEEEGRIPAAALPRLTELCEAMSKAANMLLISMATDPVTKDFLDDLTLITYGTQLRGGSNVIIGQTATMRVFNIIGHIVAANTVSSTNTCITVKNATGRTILIQFTSDPDIAIREALASGVANKVAIEVKGGQDASNLHNRVGEAEKSHNKAKADGFPECWTIINVDGLNAAAKSKIAGESPSTNRWYWISQIGDPSTPEYLDFMSRIRSACSI